jgi:hypothetical protein
MPTMAIGSSLAEIHGGTLEVVTELAFVADETP